MILAQFILDARLSIKKIQNLQFLDLKGEEQVRVLLNELCTVLPYCQNLEEISLESTQLNQLSLQEWMMLGKALAQCENLRKISLRRNKLGTVDLTSFTVICNAFLKCKSLRILNLSSNELNHLTKQHFSVLSETLSHSYITQIQGIGELTVHIQWRENFKMMLEQNKLKLNNINLKKNREDKEKEKEQEQFFDTLMSILKGNSYHSDDFTRFKELLQKVGINTARQTGYTLLHAACNQPNIPIPWIQYLLDQGANLNAVHNIRTKAYSCVDYAIENACLNNRPDIVDCFTQYEKLSATEQQIIKNKHFQRMLKFCQRANEAKAQTDISSPVTTPHETDEKSRSENTEEISPPSQEFLSFHNTLEAFSDFIANDFEEPFQNFNANDVEAKELQEQETGLSQEILDPFSDTFLDLLSEPTESPCIYFDPHALHNAANSECWPPVTSTRQTAMSPPSVTTHFFREKSRSENLQIDAPPSKKHKP